jgi:hypothetical protein
MTTSKFWRFVAVGLVAALFYLADGMHRADRPQLPTMISAAQAGDVATIVPSGQYTYSFIVTGSDDGTSIRVWRLDSGSIAGASVKYLGVYSSEGKE